jgi:hypothetical protein
VPTDVWRSSEKQLIVTAAAEDGIGTIADKLSID